jgi:hypothetical protein
VGVKGGGRGGELLGQPRLLCKVWRSWRSAHTASSVRWEQEGADGASDARPHVHLSSAWCCHGAAAQGQTPTATPCTLCNALKPAPNPRTRPPSIGAKADAGGFAAPTPACLHLTTNAEFHPPRTQ